MSSRQWLLSQLLISCLALGCGEYLGCYMETADHLLMAYRQNFIFSLTPNRCITVCKTRGFHYAGLKSRITCSCDQKAPPQAYLVEESQCQGPCVGDASKTCGGYSGLSVYSIKTANKDGVGRTESTTATQTATQTVAQTLPLSLTPLSTSIKTSELSTAIPIEAMSADMKQKVTEGFIGCYKDNTNARLLSSYSQEIVHNSPDKCKTVCYRLGFLYAGMEYGDQCYCGDTHPPAALLRSTSQCATMCPGDPSKTCGGSARLSAYDTGITDILDLGKRLGCFIDEGPRVLQGFKIDLEMTNSPRRCMNLCRSLGYRYSGVEYGVECFCGNNVNANTSRDTTDAECSMTCPGDAFETCGGQWKVTVYRTGLLDPEPKAKMVGCFVSDGSLLLKGYRQNFTQSLTPDKCTKLCYNKGFLFASLKTEKECWCDNKSPSPKFSVRDEDCTGGHFMVYVTGYVVLQPGQQDNYIGCFNDNNEGKALGGYVQEFKNTLTSDKCSQLCFNMGYLYSGTKNKKECHCGDKRPVNNLEVAGDEDCSSPCSGDRSKRCGGTGKISVYSTGLSDFSPMDKLIGCFIDDSRPRALDGHKTDFNTTNSPRKCMNYCLQLGFMFAGVEYQLECFCGNSRPSAARDAPDSDCNSVCSGDSSQTCGGGWRMQVYRTGYGTTPDLLSSTPKPLTTMSEPYSTDPAQSMMTPKPEVECEQSETLVNGKPACRGAVVFTDDFTTSAISSHWDHVVKIADAPDYEFVTFTSDAENSFQRDGNLVLKPTLLSDREVRGGKIKLEGCTGLAASRECEMSAFSYNILPPVRTARIHTRKSFNFRYGVVEIRARLPAGDWIVPELWLLPKDQSYGTNYLSGKIRVAMARGNRYLTYNGADIGSSTLESGVLVGSEHLVKKKTVINRITDSWYAHPHNYTLVWTPDNLSFFVDGQSQQALLPPRVRLVDLLGFNKSDVSAWNVGSRIAPFDTDFYLSLGLSVGTARDFPDGCVNKDKVKPWSNYKLKAMLNFWLNKNYWLPSWDSEKSSLLVEHVKVTAL